MMSFMYTRRVKQLKAKKRKVEPIPKPTGTRVCGCAKFGSVPGGDCAPGSVRSISDGILSTTFASRYRLDNMATGCNHQSKIALIIDLIEQVASMSFMYRSGLNVQVSWLASVGPGGRYRVPTISSKVSGLGC
jgi:hypothetical protein